ncbi:MAG: hypothetical protein JOZ11_07920 [Alphaproteobacteria bacterium]|nr:hypothetical protein [Alphaproteobacteria bacterium]
MSGSSNGWKPAAARFHPILLLVFVLAARWSAASAADSVPELLRQVHWGETSQDLLQQFGGAATQLPKSLDFGDSYVDVVLDGGTVGGVPVVTFFQMDKGTRGLKRVQLERPRHGVNPPAFRAISLALHAAYGRPDKICLTPVTPVGGYQAAAQELWVRGTDVISAIYRDTTLEAFEGCLFGVASGHCGLTGQLLVRISPADGAAEPDPCFLVPHRG